VKNTRFLALRELSASNNTGIKVVPRLIVLFTRGDFLFYSMRGERNEIFNR